jgi:DNA-binding GntR family transcriptional regulator
MVPHPARHLAARQVATLRETVYRAAARQVTANDHSSEDQARYDDNANREEDCAATNPDGL